MPRLRWFDLNKAGTVSMCRLILRLELPGLKRSKGSGGAEDEEDEEERSNRAQQEKNFQ